MINAEFLGGYDEIILEGHSYGCNKVVYYYTKKKDEIIKKIVLLAPRDIPVLVIFGDSDECVLTQDIETIKSYLNNNIKKFFLIMTIMSYQNTRKN